ncbi:MAG: T9SS type A sorting domain-containing protein [Aureispira sp.]
MKTVFLALLTCFCFLSSNKTFAQNDFIFNFRISINGIDYGEYTIGTGPNSTPSNPGNITTTGTLQKTTTNTQPNLPALCPGDLITLKNNCTYNGGGHSFSGSTYPPPNHTYTAFQTPTIGLTPTTGVSIPANNYTIPAIHLADVCQNCSFTTPHPIFNNWNYGTSITVTYDNAPSTYNYLAIGADGFTSKVGDWGCGHRVAYLPLTIGERPTLIDDLNICPSDVVNLNLDPTCTYSNWIPNNPNGSTLSTTTSYTVDIVKNNGCSINDAFTINIQNPDNDLSVVADLCYDESITITEDNFYDLESPGNTGTIPFQLVVNGVVIAEMGALNATLPHVISGSNYGSGVVTIEYIYDKAGVRCSKNYQVTIHPEIVLDLQNSYEVCNGNFQPICATLNGSAGQSGVNYRWRKVGSFAAPVMTPCFTPTSYGTYYVTAFITGQTGCSVRRYFTVSELGIGIEGPDDIEFCSMNKPAPNYVGWFSDPLRDLHNYLWTYTDVNGTTSFVNTSIPYQGSYQGPGTYTVVVTSMSGCTETFNITVTDLVDIQNNHPNAAFSFAPNGSSVSCQPNVTMFGVTDVWTVTDLSTNTLVTTSPHFAGIQFNYTIGVNYSVELERQFPKDCKIFRNGFKWLDDPEKREEGKKDIDFNFESMKVNTFPNPTTGLVHIELEDAENTTTSIEVLNSLGQLLLKTEVKDKNMIEIDLSKEPDGMYFLHITNGTNQVTETVIKE